MEEFIQITASDTAIGLEACNESYTLTLLGGDNEPNIDIVGSIGDLESLLSEALREVRKEMRAFA